MVPRRRSCSWPWPRASWPTRHVSEHARSEASWTSHKQSVSLVNFSSHPIMITSISQSVIGVGEIGSSLSGSSSLKTTSLSTWSSMVNHFLLKFNSHFLLKFNSHFLLKFNRYYNLLKIKYCPISSFFFLRITQKVVEKYFGFESWSSGPIVV